MHLNSMFTPAHLKSQTTRSLLPKDSTPSTNATPIPSSTNSSSQHHPKQTTFVQREVQQDPYYVTLALTRPQTTLISLIVLDNTLPTPTSTSTSSPSPKPLASHSRISTPTIVGIVFGVTLSVLVLLGVLYVYILRARQFARTQKGGSRKSISSRNKRKRRRRKERVAVPASAPAPPPQPPPPAPPETEADAPPPP
ncbi:hypothetical protein HYALB_00003665 [Hymenoscyphus albidus]|uniref:Mid2 domain-containing protein n=1 Tax=Hymenoscyphus albidus TaxID=595503 RepID=A0A9N9LJ93_9HELO|nr:hypothetical protein HYALB_00003665 [Hymenoscyphus albidus]